MGSRLRDLQWPAEPTEVAQPATRRGAQTRILLVLAVYSLAV